MKEFSTALAEVEKPEGDEAEGASFTLDGREMFAYFPGDGQITMLMGMLGRHVSTTTQVSGLIDFLMSVLDKPDAEYVTDRLFDRKDPFGHEQVVDILKWFVEEWSGTPFPQQSASPTSRKRTGAK